MKKALVLLLGLLLCFGASAAEDIPEELPEELTEGRGVPTYVCYSESGGMVNGYYSLTLESGEDLWEYNLTVHEWDGQERTIRVTKQAMDDLAVYLDKLQPETWENLPASEIMALDAPVTSVTVLYGEDEFFTLSDDKEGSWETLKNIRYFLASYLKEGKEPFTLTFSSFDGGGPSYYAVISEPEKIEWGWYSVYEEDRDPMETGSAYDVVMIFTGRIPGTVEMYIEMYGPLVPVPAEEEAKPVIYVLEIDEDYNIKLLEKK